METTRERISNELFIYCALPATLNQLYILVGQKYHKSKKTIRNYLNQLVRQRKLVCINSDYFIQTEMADIDWEKLDAETEDWYRGHPYA
ncbi:MAG: hypothetical protein LWW94_11660 [Candidatus Desulfofervidaceae bacterium]|nr:hypothetical protein [Candidatus Desulfofervidaceae bacterium]